MSDTELRSTATNEILRGYLAANTALRLTLRPQSENAKEARRRIDAADLFLRDAEQHLADARQHLARLSDSILDVNDETEPL